MDKKNILKRGFKAESEGLAILYRNELGVGLDDPICGFKLCEYLEIPIYQATEFITNETELMLLKGTTNRPPEWSALTMNTRLGNRIIIHNPFASSARQQSDIMHEIAHIICNHSHKNGLPNNLPIGLRDFNLVQEEEAKCLGSTIQLPRESLLRARKKKMSNEDIATHFNASMEMVKYRINSTAVDKQISYRRKRFGY